MNAPLKAHKADIFCSSRLPLTSTRWVGLTTKLCTVHSLSCTLSINLCYINFFSIQKCRESNLDHWVRSKNAIHWAMQPPDKADLSIYKFAIFRVKLRNFCGLVLFASVQLLPKLSQNSPRVKWCCLRGIPIKISRENQKYAKNSKWRNFWREKVNCDVIDDFWENQRIRQKNIFSQSIFSTKVRIKKQEKDLSKFWSFELRLL